MLVGTHAECLVLALLTGAWIATMQALEVSKGPALLLQRRTFERVDSVNWLLLTSTGRQVGRKTLNYYTRHC